MKYKTIMHEGERYVLVKESDFHRINVVADSDESGLPPWPPTDKDGNSPAIEFARVSIARHIISRRKALDLSQAELARRAGLPVETLNRIERVKRTVDESTMKRIEKVFKTLPRSRKPSGSSVVAPGVIRNTAIEVNCKPGKVREYKRKK